MKSAQERLRDWIGRSRITQREAAEILGMTEAFLSQLLNGDRLPGLANAIKIDDLTGITPRSWQINGVSEAADAAITRTAKRAR